MTMDAAIWTLVAAIVAICIATLGLLFKGLANVTAHIDAQGTALRSEMGEMRTELSARIDAQGTSLGARIDAQTKRIDDVILALARVESAVGGLDARLSHVEHAA